MRRAGGGHAPAPTRGRQPRGPRRRAVARAVCRRSIGAPGVEPDPRAPKARMPPKHLAPRKVESAGLEPAPTAVRGRCASNLRDDPEESDRKESNLQPAACDTAAPPLSYDPTSSGARTRTADHPLNRRALFQLSYAGIRWRQTDSNHRPWAYEAPALSTELCRRRVLQ